MPEKRNRQATRSQKMLRTALLELLNEKPLSKIGISEITERANLARSTFYMHFETKDELLESILDEILDQFFEHLYKRDILNPDVDEDLDINIKFFEIWLQNAKVIKTLNAIDIDCLLVSKLKKYWRDHDARLVSPNFPDREPALGEYIDDYLAYSFVGILRRWINDEMKYSPEIIGRLLYQLTGPPVLDAVYNNFNDLIR